MIQSKLKTLSRKSWLFVSVLVLALLFSSLAWCPVAQAQNPGILLAAHGMPGSWNQSLNDWAKPLKAELDIPLAVGFLEYSPRQDIPTAVSKLEDMGVSEIAVIQIMVSQDSSHTPEIYDALLNATDSTPIVCIASGFGNSPEMIEGIIQRGKVACVPDDNIKGDNEWIAPKDASIIISLHGEPIGDASSWDELGSCLAEGVSEQNIFKSVSYARDQLGLCTMAKYATGFPVVVPHYIVSGPFVDSLHTQLLADRMQGKLKYDGRCILDDPSAKEWVLRYVNSYINGTAEIVWSNGL